MSFKIKYKVKNKEQLQKEQLDRTLRFQDTFRMWYLSSIDIFCKDNTRTVVIEKVK